MTNELESRLIKGADILFEREMNGKMDAEYQRWLRGWLKLLNQYERDYRDPSR